MHRTSLLGQLGVLILSACPGQAAVDGIWMGIPPLLVVRAVVCGYGARVDHVLQRSRDHRHWQRGTGSLGALEVAHDVSVS